MDTYEQEQRQKDQDVRDFARSMVQSTYERIEIINLKKAVKRYEDALREIADGEGAYSSDRLTHAENVIENLVGIAKEALGG